MKISHLGILSGQKNEILDILEEEGFSRSDFSLSDLDNQTYIQYKKDKKYYCSIRITNNVYYNKVEVAPGHQTLNQSYDPETGQWKDFISYIKLWAKNLKRETSTIDKWQEIKDRADNAILFDFKTNDNFKESEKEVIRSRIRLIQTKLKALELAPEKLHSIDEKLNELSEKLDTLNKTNWFELFTGAIIGQILSLSIPQTTANQIWEIIKGAFGSFIQLE